MRKPLFIVTVDTESDDCWERPESISLQNIRAIPRFQELCEKYGVVPTYLVTYECATRDEAISVLKPILDSEKCEIGHHLHAWTTPPFERESNGVDLAWLHAYQLELPESLFEEKSYVLKETIGKTFCFSPKSHRAGRWGIDQRGIDWLIENDFTVDTSVVPLTSYAKSIGKFGGGPNFSRTKRTPFYIPSTQNEGKSLLEIPVTVDIPRDVICKYSASWMTKGFPATAFFQRILKRFKGGWSLRPRPEYPDNTLTNMASRAINDGLPILNLMLHSSELALGCSPFTKNEGDLERVWNHIEHLFKYVHSKGIKGITSCKAAEYLEAYKLRTINPFRLCNC